MSFDVSAYLSHTTFALQLRAARDGYPECLGPPLDNLASDFPLQPSLTGHLLPQQVNMWMGLAKNGELAALLSTLPVLLELHL